MFGEYGENSAYAEAFDVQSWSDAKLLEAYKFNQESAQMEILGRARSEEKGNKELTEIHKKEISGDFTFLNMLRTEMDRRGLQAPTMEERGPEDLKRKFPN